MQLSSGRRVNAAADDAAALGVSQIVTAQAIKAGVEIRTLNDTISSYQEAEGHLSGMSDVLQRMKELAVQARNEALSDSQINQIFVEFEQLLAHYTEAQGNAGIASVDTPRNWSPPKNLLVDSLSWSPVVTTATSNTGLTRPQYLAASGSVSLPGTTSSGTTGLDIDSYGHVEVIESTATSSSTALGGATEAYFSVNLNANQWYRFYTSPAYASDVLTLVDADGNTVATGTYLLTAKLTEGGTYYVKTQQSAGLGTRTLNAEAYHPEIPSTGNTYLDSVLTGNEAFWREVGSQMSTNGALVAPGVNGLGAGSALTTITYSFMNTSSGGATATGGLILLTPRAL